MLALVTGASSGIGKEIALYLNKLGYDLILAASNKEKLLSVEKELVGNNKTFAMDLTKEENVFELYEKTKNDNIDILVNNAGFGLFGEFVKTDLKRELEMIDLNVKAYHILTKLFLQDFVARDYGYILNVCSSAGFMAGPRLSTYYATKNYVTKLTTAINEELRRSKSNVVISALCPGPVETNFNNVAKGEFSIKGADPKYIAKYAVDKMFKGKMLIIPKATIKLAIFATRFMPTRLQLMINYNIQWRKEKNRQNEKNM